MQIKRKSAFTVFLSFFLTLFCVTTVFADDTPTGRSPSDASVGIVYPTPSAQTSVKEEKTNEAIKRTPSLSYGLDIIRRGRKLVKTTANGKAKFSLSDFLPFADNGIVGAVTIVSVPEVSTGVLKAGALDTFAGQRLSSQMADSLCFYSSGAPAAKFVFSVNGKEEAECEIYLLREENSAPAASSGKVYTKTNAPAFGSLNVSDPDGGTPGVRVVKQPSHGRLTVNSDLTFVYTPDDGFRGKDSFTYTAYDKYGASSDEATVSVTVEKRYNGVVYADAVGTDFEYAALLLSERGILTGENVAGTMRFEPEKTVSRADFIVMAMSASGYAPNMLDDRSTGAADEDKLTKTEKGYVITAMSAGVISADDYDGVKLLRPTSTVTLGEAAEMIRSLKAEAAVDIKNANDPLTRAEASKMLASLIDLGR
ncbi:MAG: cadherin-like domain-containing protein [Clostridia bacterium]|nr:cadherin-like domain-containing protein [Clostridia bacterium]